MQPVKRAAHRHLSELQLGPQPVADDTRARPRSRCCHCCWRCCATAAAAGRPVSPLLLLRLRLRLRLWLCLLLGLPRVRVAGGEREGQRGQACCLPRGIQLIQQLMALLGVLYCRHHLPCVCQPRHTLRHPAQEGQQWEDIAAWQGVCRRLQAVREVVQRCRGGGAAARGAWARAGRERGVHEAVTRTAPGGLLAAAAAPEAAGGAVVHPAASDSGDGGAAASRLSPYPCSAGRPLHERTAWRIPAAPPPPAPAPTATGRSRCLAPRAAASFAGDAGGGGRGAGPRRHRPGASSSAVADCNCFAGLVLGPLAESPSACVLRLCCPTSNKRERPPN